MSWKVRLAEAVTIVVSRHPDEMADLRPGWSEAHRVEGPTKINCCRFVSLYALKAPALTGVFYCFNSLTNPTNQPSIPGTIARILRAFLLPAQKSLQKRGRL